MTGLCTILSAPCTPAILDMHAARRTSRPHHPAVTRLHASHSVPRSHAHLRSPSLIRAAHADSHDSSASQDINAGSRAAAEINAWDSMTDRLVGATSIPFSILVLPQAYTNYLNMAAGNGAALSILSWEVRLKFSACLCTACCAGVDPQVPAQCCFLCPAKIITPDQFSCTVPSMNTVSRPTVCCLEYRWLEQQAPLCGVYNCFVPDKACLVQSLSPDSTCQCTVIITPTPLFGAVSHTRLLFCC